MSSVDEVVKQLKRDFKLYSKENNITSPTINDVKSFLISKKYSDEVVSHVLAKYSNNDPKSSTKEEKIISILNTVKDVIRTKTTPKQRIDLRRYLENE